MDFPRKIYIDSRFREQTSKSSSDFVYELARNINLPKRCAGFITDVTIPVNWRNFDVNGKYFYFLENTAGSNVTRVARVEIPAANYTAPTLANALRTALNAGSPHGFTYTVTYDNSIGKLSITTPSIREFDWTGTWSLETSSPPNLSGTWDAYDGIDPSPDSFTLNRVTSTIFTYTDNGVTATWTINNWDVSQKQLSLTESWPDGTTVPYVWDDTLKRLVAHGGSSSPPDLSGTWAWAGGATSTSYTWTPVSGSAVAYTYTVSGTTYTATVQSNYNNATPSMTVYINTLTNPSPSPLHIYNWSIADQRLNSTTNTNWSWTKSTTQTFPAASGEYWTKAVALTWPATTVEVTKLQTKWAIDGAETWSGDYATGGQDLGGDAVTYDAANKKLVFASPYLSNLLWAGNDSPTETFNSVAGIHPLSDIQLANHNIYTMFNSPSVFNNNNPITYDRNDPKSMSEALRNEGIVSDIPQTYNANRPWVSGILDIDHENQPLYITSTNMCMFNSSMGPRGEHIYLRRIGASAPFGSTLRDQLQTDLDYFVCAREAIKTLHFRLVNARGATVNLNGADWSFAIIFQPLN